MSNRYLITLFLDFDFLVRYKLTGFNLQNQLTLYVVLSAFNRRALDLRVEFFSIYYLINFKTTSIACKYSYPHARLNIRSTNYNTFNCNKRSNVLTLNFTHLDDIFLSKLSRNNEYLKSSFKFWRNLLFSINFGSLSSHAVLLCHHLSLLEVKASLLHNNFKSA